MKSKYPECEKLNAPAYQHLRNFAEFLEEQGYEITIYKSTGKEAPVDVPVSPINAVYHYLDVNPKLLEKERQAILKSYQTLNR